MTLTGRFLFVTCLLSISMCVSNAADPDWYLKQGTWHDSWRLSREAYLARSQSDEASGRPEQFVSEIVRGGDAARKIKIAVAGARELYLIVIGAPDVVRGAATWADAKLIDAGGSAEHVCHLDGLKILEGRHSIDQNLYSGFSGPLQIDGQQFDHGVHVYANSKIRVPVSNDAQRFAAWIGIDDWVGDNGAVRFIVGGPSTAAKYDLWNLVARDFPEERPRRRMKWERFDRILDQDWIPGDYRTLAERYAAACFRVPQLEAEARAIAVKSESGQHLQAVREMYYRSRRLHLAGRRARALNVAALRGAIQDLVLTYPREYSQGAEFLQRLTALESKLKELKPQASSNELTDLERATQLVADFDALQSEALLANPLLDFDRLLMIRRAPDGDPRRTEGRGYGLGEYLGLPRQSSKCNPNIEKPIGWENELAVLSPVSPDGQLTTLYKPDNQALINDVDLHFDAGKMIFSMPADSGFWRVWEVGADGKGLKQLPAEAEPDVHYYDPCYLPNGKITLVSTAVFQGVPCNTGVIVGMLYAMDGEGRHVQQLCFEQDHDYCPTVMNDGRILYLRWDYTDTPHVWNRMLFTMNPDGTGQAEYYGANSYWPNSIFYARPIPEHPSKFVGIVTGHHVGRVGELVLFDPAKSKFEADGVVQRIPGRGQKVEPLIQDKLTEHSWPKFLHPYPLSDKYFLVSCKPTPDSLWGIYLVDVFDNMVLIREEQRVALLEPIPFRQTPTPPVIPDRVDPTRDDALVHLMDVHQGPAMQGIPRGTVKQLRVFTYHFGYQEIAGITDRIGSDGPWEAKRVLGTVPIHEDGSAWFRVPAKTPISVQPLDAEGKAVQLMRSWMTAMPGETLACVGCHQQEQSTAPPNRPAVALSHPAAEIRPWYGPTRGFSFRREVQPVLDRYCVGCHDGSQAAEPIPDLRGDQGFLVVYKHGQPDPIKTTAPIKKLLGKYRGIFDPSYIELRRLVRVGGLESDLHLLSPMEFHADTSELVQMMLKGHHNVQLDDEAWDRLITWIDLNAPFQGTWSEFTPIRGDQRSRRLALRKLYGGVDEDGEVIPKIARQPIEPIIPEPLPAEEVGPVTIPNWPLATSDARQMQTATPPAKRTLDLGDGVSIEMVKIPAGHFLMGDAAGEVDERPQSPVTINEPFWMSRHEITNRQYKQFNPDHDSRFEHRTSWIFSEEYLGWPLNQPRQPVVRVSWNEAIDFCRWMSAQVGETITLPTEAQWEYACRAGTATPWSYGNSDVDFSTWANMADINIRRLAYDGWRPKPLDLVPRDTRFDDGALVTTSVGSFNANAWGLHDMHGNAAEWTRSSYRPYPYGLEDARSTASGNSRMVVRGGSWYDRPKRCRSSFRLSYHPHQRVYNVGFRVICSATPMVAQTQTPTLTTTVDP